MIKKANMKRPIKVRKHKINGEVRFPEVRVTGDGGGKIMSSYEASKIAQEMGADLILISENANPPVVRIEDYNKFLYEIEKREKEIKKNQKRSEIKELTFSPNIADHDLGVKSKKAQEFLIEGNKVKCTLLLKGRENSMSERGHIVMLKFATLLEEVGVPEDLPKLEGNKWIMIMRPVKK
jgi:translation initiation factor IF-3